LPFGRLDVQTTINQQDADSPTGRWTGVQWTHDEISRDGGWRALLAIGHRTDAGDGILYLDVVDNTSDDPLAFSFIVLYDL
jgi:hypothetical protein